MDKKPLDKENVEEDKKKSLKQLKYVDIYFMFTILYKYKTKRVEVRFINN